MADNDNTNKWKWFFLMPMYVAPADIESAKAAAANLFQALNKTK
jgi:hypothetical protein